MRHLVNLADVELRTFDQGPAGHLFSGRSITEQVGAKLTGLGIYEVGSGEATWPYHFELGEEEWLFVVSGQLTLRRPEGEQVLQAGDTVCFPAGAAGAHAMRNGGTEVARYAMVSRNSPNMGATVYPDSDKFSIGGPGFHHRGRLGDALDYWDGEK